MRPVAEVEAVRGALDAGMNAREACRATGVPWRTIQKWRQAGIDEVIERHRLRAACGATCSHVTALQPDAYAYLLGQYLGDGSIASFPRSVFRLEVASDLRYPDIIDEVCDAMVRVLPASVACVRE
ncbi:MAG: hypothetical protein QOD30_1039, partial [Actinomycetota bacterium]|nr:hypothetical protein [Actinomycetota bacterium]